MGTWGYQTFEDDTACDWLSELEKSKGTEVLERSLSPEGDEESYLESEDGIGILAAAEIVYGLLNGPREGLPEEAIQWIGDHQHLDVSCLKPVCERQLGRVLFEHSELRELWEENEEEYPAWKSHVQTLLEGFRD